MTGKINRFLLFILFMFLYNVTFAKGAKDFSRSLYLENHSEEIIRDAILSNPNVKEIAKMIKLPDSSQYRIYLVMKIPIGPKATDKMRNWHT